jgi:hypothetical protein
MIKFSFSSVLTRERNVLAFTVPIYRGQLQESYDVYTTINERREDPVGFRI